MGKDKNNKDFKYASAPYNFIPFPEKIVYRRDAENITHEKNCENLKKGYIEYSINTLSPLFIDDGKGDFFKINEKYSIPSGTVRGKVYSNAEILSSSYPQFIKDNQLWHRGCFEDTILKEVYNKRVKPNPNEKINQYVQSGYLKIQNDKWIIQPTVKLGKKNFEIIDEQKLIHLKKYLNTKCYMYNDEKYNKDTSKDFWNEIYKLKKQTHEKFKLLRKYANKGFQPYFRNVTYYVSGENTHIKYILGDNYKKFNNTKYGVLMNSNNLSCKQVHYLIYEEDVNANPIEIKQDIMDQYNINVKLRQDGEIKGFNLGDIKRRKTIPIFYIVNKNEEIISLGFTPYLKIPYKNSIKDLIKINRENQLDYIQSIFGCCNLSLDEGDKYSLKGRVSFTNARLAEQNGKSIKLMNEINKVLSEPKPTSFQLYLKQKSICQEKLNGNEKLKKEYIKEYKKQLNTYEQNCELRGSKFYWLKDSCDIKNEEVSKVRSSIKAIEKNSKFIGRIYFENLNEVELGLILMAIKPFENAMDSIGKGKPYGFGKVEFKIEDIKEIDTNNIFGSLNFKYLDYDDLQSRINMYIEKFKYKMKESGEDIESYENKRIQAFYLSKSKEVGLKGDEFNYMKLEKFKNREPLKNIEMYIDEINIGEREVAASKIKKK